MTIQQTLTNLSREVTEVKTEVKNMREAQGAQWAKLERLERAVNRAHGGLAVALACGGVAGWFIKAWLGS